MFKKLLFLYGEAHAYCDQKGNNFISSLFDSVFWDRYFDIAESILVIMRRDNCLADNNMIRVTNPQMDLYLLDSATDSLSTFFSIRRRKNNCKVIEEALSQCDAAIIRLPSFIGNEAISMCKKKKIPYLIEVVGDPYASMRYHGIKGRILAPFYGFMMRKYVKSAQFVLYVSNSYMQRLYPTKGKSVGCPDANIVEVPDAVLDNRLKRIDSNNKIILGLVGSLNVDYRGHDTLIQVLKSLQKNGIDCEVRFLGGGEKQRWEEYAQRNGVEGAVFFSGTLQAGERVYEWLDNIDILVMPTKVESLGRSVVEAMSRGCPVIGTSTTALSELVSSECQVLPDDVDRTVSIIMQLISNKNYMKLCACENFFRAKKYCNSMTNPVRKSFFEEFATEGGKKVL